MAINFRFEACEVTQGRSDLPQTFGAMPVFQGVRACLPTGRLQHLLIRIQHRSNAAVFQGTETVCRQAPWYSGRRSFSSDKNSRRAALSFRGAVPASRSFAARVQIGTLSALSSAGLPQKS